MKSLSSLFSPGLRLMLGYGKQLSSDISEETFASKPIGKDNQIIDKVHPAFVFGHLGVYPEKICNLLEINSADAEAPEGFEDLFQKGKACEHDPDRKIYPAKEAILNNYFTKMESILERLPSVDNEVYFKDNPIETAVERFPTVGAFISFLLSGHIAMHMGQLSSWRRAMGMSGV